jgi:Ca2+-transporting ATPase
MKEKKAYQQSVEDVLRQYETDVNAGLTWKEAEKRLARYGENLLAGGERINPLFLFFSQFKDFMVFILLVATLLSGWLGEYTDALTIVAIVLLNAVLGFVQEYRAENSLQALKQMTAPECRVLRDRQLQKIPAKTVVPGDIVYLESGDRIPADLRLAVAEGLRIEEAALTGESLPVAKFADPLPDEDLSLGDRQNMAYMGTSVVQGKGIGIVVATGMQTEMGKIAHLMHIEDEEVTPLQHRLAHLGQVLVVACLLLTGLVVGLGIWHGQELYQMFLAGVSLAVAAIPEGLPAIVTVSLALGVQRMIKRQAIIRKLPAVETLGTATVICSDKTGTLTQNRMTVTHIWIGGRKIEVKGEQEPSSGPFVSAGLPLASQRHRELQWLLEIGCLCNNAQLIENGRKRIFGKKKHPDKIPAAGPEGDWLLQGDPTEGAVLFAGLKAGLNPAELRGRWRRIKEFPFDPSRKMMSVVVEDTSRNRWVLVKGAPDVLLERCTQIVYGEKEQLLSPAFRKNVMQANESLAQMALRNLGFAYRRLRPGEIPLNEAEAEQGLVFLGLMGMIDPPRPEVKQAIALCRRAGIRTVMITGDHQTTAEAIARQLGILPPGGRVLTGSQLSRMGQSELAENIDQIYVYARVAPEHKLRIVKTLQAKGEVVAMTGDGVNDAPAVKAADIGIAMGRTGTDVTKEAASLVLANDNFATIVAAVEEGRGIYENIRKFIRYMMASNVGEIFTMLIAMLLAMPLPLLPIHILWVNLVTDGLPAMALGVDTSEENVMHRPPRDARESVFARGMGWKIISRGLLIGLVTVGSFWLTLAENPDDLLRAQTVAFATLVMAQLIHVFDCRCERSVFDRNPFENRWLVLSVIMSVLMLLAVIYVGVLQPVFHTTALHLREWALILFAAAIPTFIAGIPALLSGKPAQALHPMR